MNKKYLNLATSRSEVDLSKRSGFSSPLKKITKKFKIENIRALQDDIRKIAEARLKVSLHQI